MDGWWLLLLVSGGLTVSSGIEIFTALAWGKLDTFGWGAALEGTTTRKEPERFKHRFTFNLVLFILSMVFFLVALLAILNPAGS